MEDFKFMNSGSDIEDEKIIASASYIVRALKSRKRLTNDVRQVLVNLGTQLSILSMLDDDQSIGDSDIEHQVAVVQDTIMSWEDNESVVWFSDSGVAPEYLNAADEARKLTEKLETLCVEKGDVKSELLRRAHDVLQTAMARLEEEFKNLLIHNRQQREPERISFRSTEEESFDDSSTNSATIESVDSFQRERVGRISAESTIDLVHPDVIPELKSIAHLMFRSYYDHECSQAYINIRKDGLDECLSLLEIEKFSIEDVLKMEWGSLNSKIKRWTRAIKVYVRVYLTSERFLCDQIFGELGSASSDCFLQASKNQILQLLNFGEAISISPRQPERLFRILDMYEVLADLLPDIDILYAEPAGSAVRTEFHSVLQRLGESAKATFLDFKNVIASNSSTQPFAAGGVHHITKYVMNYMTNIVDYSETLMTLLKSSEEESPTTLLMNTSLAVEEENTSEEFLSSEIPLAIHFQSIASILEHNIYQKSTLYKDASLQHFFLMNNIYYMTQKVKKSELRLIFGDDWIRKHNSKFQKLAMEYERAAWIPLLALLKDEGMYNPGSNSVSKPLLKERIRCFNLAFEDIYRTQTAWLTSDDQLREDLRISTSLRVVQAYRSFVGRHINHISEKHIKYSADDVQNYLLDLFEGSPKSLQNISRR